ncbi:MAG: winged helix-turn-helix domain-containing protein [Novosphingobium sp.]
MIEEDREFGVWLADRLADSGFVAQPVSSAEQALRSGLAERTIAFLINLGLSGQAGTRHVRPLRDAGLNQPLIVLSSQCHWRERVECLDAGADDYLTKPVRAEEVAARLRAIIRRTTGKPSDCIVSGNIELDIKARTARLGGLPLDLTRNEFRLLRLFLLQSDRILSHRELHDRLYAEPSGRSLNAVEVNIARLRRKIGKDAIRTVRGIGYRFVSNEGERKDLAFDQSQPMLLRHESEVGAWFPCI